MEKVYATIISHLDIIDQLNKLNPNKSRWPDKIHPQVLKVIKDGLIAQLHLFNSLIYKKSLHHGALPTMHVERSNKYSYIHKKGSLESSKQLQTNKFNFIFVEC